MANYNQFKQAWDSMNDTQRKQAVEQNKNNAQFQQFAQQYNNEVNWWSVNVQQVVQQANKNWNLNNTTNQWTNTQWSTTTNQNQTNANGTNWQNNTNNSGINNWWTTWTDKSVVSQDFDQSRLTNDNAQVSVKEWTASQTWMPDYELNSDARDNEIVNNLNAYINSNPEFFTDRNTFNQSFHYSERNSRQKALLDSFWKGQEDKKTASNYNTGDAIATGMKNSDITPDIMNLIRQNNPEAYAEWQKQMQEEINKRIANFTTPADPYSTADLFKSLVEKLNIEPEDPLQIYDNWYWMCERLGVFKDSEKLANQQAQIEANHKQIENITKKYSANAGWATSSALSAARLNKALQPYLAIESSLQNEYSLLLQWRNSNLAIANQSANAMVMQANENQRIFNQKLSWLGFAVTTANFRTPEQTLQNQLNYQSALNDLNLLNQSKLNDLARYNLYANTKLQNQLNSELQDLNTEDENQLRSNLNNILSQYYSSYWDIIQRSQPQVVDDILKYAKEKGISVWEALTQNFIKPLQSKPEFRNSVAAKYPSMNTVDQPKWTWKDNWDGTSSLTIQWVWDVPEWLNRQQRVQEYSNIAEQLNYNVQNTALAMSTAIKNWTITGQCWAFTNDYLTALWLSNIFWDYLDEKESKMNQDYPTIWSVAIMDFWVKDKNWRLYWHTWIVTWINKDWSIVITDSNWAWDEKKLTHTLTVNDMKSVKWYYNPIKDLTWGTTVAWTFEWNWNSYDYSKYSWWNQLTDDEKQTVENLLTYQTDPASLPKSWKDNWASNQRVRAAAAAIGRDYGYSERKFQLVKNAEKKWDDAALPWWVSSANSTSMSILKAMSDSFDQWYNKFNINTVNSWINEFKKETWDPTAWTMYTTSRVAASEIAKALKWWASATEQEVEDMKNLLDWNMGNEQAKAVFQAFAKSLYEKNESEAKKFYETTWYKPNPIWTDEAVNWMTSLWIDLSKYYNYEAPIGWMSISGENAPATSYSLNFTSKYKK